jgi:hypothetical protein
MVSVVMVVAKRGAKVETVAQDVVAVNVMVNGQMAKILKVATIPEVHAAMDEINDPIIVRIKRLCQIPKMLLKI